MGPINWYDIWTSGKLTASLKISLDPTQSYLVTGGFMQTSGGDSSHAYISEVCQGDGDEITCGVRDMDGDGGLNLYEFLSGAVSVTIKLKSSGGFHKVEGSIYQL